MEKRGERLPIAERINDAKVNAREAMLDWSLLAIANIESRIEISQSVRQDTIQSGYRTMVEMRDTSYERRTVHITDTVYGASKSIDQAGLDTENKKQVTEYSNGLLKSLTQREDERTGAIKDGYKNRTAEINNNEQYSRQTIEDRRVFIHDRLNRETVLQLGFKRLEEEIANLTRRTNDILLEREGVIDRVVSEKISSLRSIINNKDAELDASIRNFRTQLDAKIANTLRNQQVQQTRAQQQQRANQKASAGQSRQRTAQGGPSGARQTGQRTGTNGSQQRPQTPPKKEAPRPQDDPRIKTLMGKTTGAPKQPYVTVLGNIDHHRGKGKSDEDIYKLLVKSFHPDKGIRANGEEVLKVLSEAYDKTSKTFRV